ncbi:MAG TPA: hypothetical protein VMF89_35635, partial [Polyangiales bacterium]|nr:hypothetical protein [Polyangiales bacterium]
MSTEPDILAQPTSIGVVPHGLLAAACRANTIALAHERRAGAYVALVPRHTTHEQPLFQLRQQPLAAESITIDRVGLPTVVRLAHER